MTCIDPRAREFHIPAWLQPAIDADEVQAVMAAARDHRGIADKGRILRIAVRAHSTESDLGVQGCQRQIGTYPIATGWFLAVVATLR